MVVYHLPKFSGKSGWKVNGTQLFVGCVVGFALKGEGEGEGAGRIWARERLLRSLDFSVRVKRDVTKTGNGERGAGSGERGAGNGERKSGNELSAETSTKIQNGGPKNEREKEDDKERNSCLG